MIKCENLSEKELERIGRQIAEAFLAEKGTFASLSHETASKMFKLIVETCYQAGHLYKSSEREEGFCVYWTKKERPGLMAQMKMMLKMAVSLPWKAGKVLMDGESDWTPTEKRYKKRDDFVEVFLIAVRKEYQGQGVFRSMIEEPFALAKERGTICVLDTDSELKAEKYSHLGMKIIERKVQKNGMEMFAMELSV